MTASLTPMINVYSVQMKKNGILDSNNQIDIDKFENESNEFFRLVPTINIPLGNVSIPITKKDVDKFITELFSKGDAEEVIYLPCHN